MKYVTLFILANLFGMISCNKKEDTSVRTENCISSELNKSATYTDLISEIPLNILTALVELPDEDGALERNKEGYFHVRFQLNMTRLTDYAVKTQNREALVEYLKNLNYSFSYQKPEGDFQFEIPDYLLQDSNYQSLTESDLASGTAFFAYSLGLSLNCLSQSDWYKNNTTITDLKSAIISLNPTIEKMLTYLKNSVGLLNIVDKNAPNRLLFNAIAFYSLGIYLDDLESKNIGLDFANMALSQQNKTQGYFIEGGNWDSSYNGVAIKLAFELFTLLPHTSNSIKDEIEKIVSCATDWQKSRILPSGEISTEGNTRVFPGGEVFLGNEKQVDFVKTIKAFFYMSTLSKEKEYEVLAQKIIAYYN